ncbi:HipA domain-containing protein [Thermosulfuriphilus sp.]
MALVNLLIVNTDDHLKNFSLLWDGRRLCLAPAYDLVGNLWGIRDHSLPLFGKTDRFGGNDLVHLGKSLGIRANQIKEDIEKALEALEAYLARLKEIPGTDFLQAAIKTRRKDILES